MTFSKVLAILLILSACLTSFEAGYFHGAKAGYEKGLQVGVDNCDPYLPNDPSEHE